MNLGEQNLHRIVDRRIINDRRQSDSYLSDGVPKRTVMEKRSGKNRRILKKRRRIERWYC